MLGVRLCVGGSGVTAVGEGPMSCGCSLASRLLCLSHCRVEAQHSLKAFTWLQTCWSTWPCSLAFSFLSLSSVTCSFIRNERVESRCWCEGRLHPHLYFTINQTVGLWDWVGGDSPRCEMLKLSQDERMLMCRSWGTVCLCACMLGEGA